MPFTSLLAGCLLSLSVHVRCLTSATKSTAHCRQRALFERLLHWTVLLASGLLQRRKLLLTTASQVSYIAMVRMLDTYSLVAATTTLGIATLAGRAMYRRMAQ